MEETKEKIVNYCERHNLLSEDIDYFVDLFKKALRANQEDLLRKIEGMLSYTDKDGKVWIYKDQLKQLLK